MGPEQVPKHAIRPIAEALTLIDTGAGRGGRPEGSPVPRAGAEIRAVRLARSGRIDAQGRERTHIAALRAAKAPIVKTSRGARVLRAKNMAQCGARWSDAGRQMQNAQNARYGWPCITGGAAPLFRR
jgi:hypothetical protein